MIRETRLAYQLNNEVLGDLGRVATVAALRRAPDLGRHDRRAPRARPAEKILGADARLARRQGTHAISTTELAAEAGITWTVLYNYLADKTALLLAFTERVTQYFVERYACDLPADASPSIRLRAFVRFQPTGLVAHRPGCGRSVRHPRPDAYQRLAAHVAPMQRRSCGRSSRGASTLKECPDVPTWTAVARAVLSVLGFGAHPPDRGGPHSRSRPRSSSAVFSLRALGSSQQRL